jgi:DegV family protein with EDD domain
MPRIRIVTDSTCDIPESLLRQFDIAVVPLTVRPSPGGVISASRSEYVTPDELVARMQRGVLGQLEVAAPEIEDLISFYRQVRDTCDGVLSIHCSSKLSDTVSNAMVARESFGPMGPGGAFPIAVVDSLSMSMGLGWLALALAREALKGDDLSRLASKASRLIERSHVAFYSDRPEVLHRVGRVPRLQSGWEGLASTTPLYHIDEGHVVVYERTRTRPKARDALYNFVEDFPKIGDIAVIHTGAANDVELLLTRVGAIYPRERVLVIQASPPIAAWLGPEAVGVAVIEAEDPL